MARDDLVRRRGSGRRQRTGFLSGELHRTENAGYLADLRSAILRGHRPTFLILGKQPDSKWTDLDRALFRALDIYNREGAAKEHGVPFWVSENETVILTVDEGVDHAQAALEDWDKNHPNEKRKPGQFRFVVPQDGNGEEMQYGGITRQRYLEGVSQEKRDRQLEDDIDFEIEDRPEGGYDPTEYGDG